MVNCTDQRTNLYLDLYEVKTTALRQVETPDLAEDDIKAEEREQPGKLAPCAAKIVMKYLWLVGMTR